MTGWLRNVLPPKIAAQSGVVGDGRASSELANIVDFTGGVFTHSGLLILREV